MKRVENFNIEENTTRLKTSRRGGGIEISLDALGAKYEGHKMSAYQNYLGGGMLGSIQNDFDLQRSKMARGCEADPVGREVGPLFPRSYE